MTAQVLIPTNEGSVTLLRNEPVQARSAVRLTTLLDAAAAVVHEIGFERLTTAMVAERAGSSIGTVYRYFPDRLIVLRALSVRSLTRWESEGIEALNAAAASGSWLDVVGAALDYWVDAFRNEPGFRSLRFGDVIDIRPRSEAGNNAVIARSIATVIADNSDLNADDIVFDVEVALTTCDALLARAFAGEGEPEDRFIDSAVNVAKAHVVARFGSPS